MSYYTYYKIKKDSKYSDTAYFENVLKNISDGYKEEILSLKSNIILKIIYYYNQKDINILGALSWVLTQLGILKCGVHYDMTKSILESIKEDEDHEYIINHAPSSYNMRNSIDDFEKVKYDTATKLISLALIKFKKEDEYTDTAQTTFDWLMYDMQNHIKDILTDFEDACYDVAKYEFLLENCDSEDEGQRCKEEIIGGSNDGE